MLKHIKQRDDWAEKSFSAKGFTLIELLVVIVILGILAAVVVFAVGGITDRGKTSACKTDLRTLKTAVEAFRANSPTGLLPANEAALVPGFLDSVSTSYDYTLTGTTATGTVTYPLQGTYCA